MGSYLSRHLGRYLRTAKAALPRPAWGHRYLRARPAHHRRGPVQSQVISVHRERWMQSRTRLPLPPHLDHPRVQRAIVPKAWRSFHGKSPLHTFPGLDLSSSRESFVRHCLWKAQNVLNVWNMVTVNITPPEGGGSSSSRPATQERPHSCAKEIRLRARSPGQRGKKRSRRSLRFEGPPAKRRKQSPGARPSAFRPVWKDGMVRAFVPRPGPLRRGVFSWHPAAGEDTQPGPDALPGHQQAPGESPGLGLRADECAPRPGPSCSLGSPWYPEPPPETQTSSPFIPLAPALPPHE
ncbi:POM121-like protein 2 [Enhydra lutris kenyoni]|uniref:POM121-like protein 2 n=1 Tax=Enhydra lutris kenyoni TaxID=391180 RepID=A0A2Y9IIP7_ENHLU|nr:POM121-like protein 2 [Enhydra lutris kenyoni]